MWHYKSFEQLTTEELFQIFKARLDVFVVEQECPYPEIDQIDKEAIHIFKSDQGRLVAYCRLIPTDQMTKLGRVLVLKDLRKEGLGRDLVKNAINYSQKQFPDKTIYAQAYLQDFYHTFGFKASSQVYLEDNIPHIDMIKDIES
ncbi:GNAT family N-acetyltransferase [Streptococcus catagoni]|uniref:GNAT family N-acetyltransferase n=1 Tax=Streptococcus catagoni TaxID=2654874 RepID=UPI0014096FB2|nr:GNAT family N-acetyltransferase [Streptococcus catagoni]